MITLTTIFILLYVYSIYRIKKESGSWEEFNPFNANFITYGIFVMGTVMTIILICFFVVYLIYSGILP
jgi:hypothetical protein